MSNRTVKNPGLRAIAKEQKAEIYRQVYEEAKRKYQAKAAELDSPEEEEWGKVLAFMARTNSFMSVAEIKAATGTRLSTQALAANFKHCSDYRNPYYRGGSYSKVLRKVFYRTNNYIEKTVKNTTVYIVMTDVSGNQIGQPRPKVLCKSVYRLCYNTKL